MTEALTLDGVRVLVVGASTGIGRSFANEAIGMGADVCVSARRLDLLVELCRQADGGHAIAADVTEPDDCRRLVDAAVERMGGLDLVLYAAGAATMAPVAETTAEDFERAFAVNAIGANSVCAAALPSLSPNGLISFLSSEATGDTRWGLASYTASKTALDTIIRFWRREHPEFRFQRILLGATAPTGFPGEFSHDVLDFALTRWSATGVPLGLMDTDDVGRHLAEVLSVVMAHGDIGLPDIYLEPRGQAWT